MAIGFLPHVRGTAFIQAIASSRRGRTPDRRQIAFQTVLIAWEPS